METSPPAAAAAGLAEAAASGRIHSAYLFAGPGEAPRAAAQEFARALACETQSGAACGNCAACRRSAPRAETPALDGTGKKGPLLRHIGAHPDLLWVERGADDTRVRIGQVRALQEHFRLQSAWPGRRAAVIADAEWLNQEAQNALLRILEEPPPRASFVLITAQPSGLLATVRSRCMRVNFPAPRRRLADAPDEIQAQVQRLQKLPRMKSSQVLNWAEEFRGARAPAAAAANELLQSATAWLHQNACTAAAEGAPVDARLAAWRTLQHCRKSLVQRNANPQMVAERALFALRDAAQEAPA